MKMTRQRESSRIDVVRRGAGEAVDFDVAVVAGANRAKCGARKRLGDEGDFDFVCGARCDSERHTVNGDRALLRAQGAQTGRERNADSRVAVSLVHAFDMAHAVDVPLHEVTADERRRLERWFKVDGASRRHCAKSRSAERFADNVERGVEVVTRHRARHGEAHAADSDRVSRLGRIGPMIRLDAQQGPFASRSNLKHAAHSLHNSRKHVSRIRKRQSLRAQARKAR